MENKEQAGILNDLIQINNDRIVGYEKAAKELKDEDAEMKAVFHNMAEESKGYKKTLEAKVRSLGETPATDTTASGKIYRAWMDLKATFTGKDLQAILASCEFGEDAAQAAYSKAVTESEHANQDIRQLILEQKSSLKTSHDLMKHYRDREGAKK